MANNILRLFTNTVLKNWKGNSATHRLSHSITTSTAFQNCQGDPSCAFWDPEGSVNVNQSQTGDLSYLEKNETSERKIVPEKPVEVIRKTKFGYIRLDNDNKMDITAQNEDSLNFIDGQFFGSQALSSQNQPHQDLNVKASDVPLDTNPIDQQYFYPNKEDDGEAKYHHNSPSAADLEFKDNEMDNQYFGKNSSSDTLHSIEDPTKMSASDYLRFLRSKEKSDILPLETEGEMPIKTYSDYMTNFRNLSRETICTILKKSILYNKDGIVAINKPYGISTTDVDGKSEFVLTNYLPAFAKLLKYDKLHTVHRLDRDTTGVLLLATNEEMAGKLNKLFFERKIEKKYVAITKTVPEPREGTIDIPICKKIVGDRERMALRPVRSHNSPESASYNAKSKALKAVTHYKVVRVSEPAALLELEPETGVRHQLRVHLSDAINCQVLGDHKYAHNDRYAPQKLQQSLLDRLGVRQSKVRNVPMHLHSSSVVIPELGPDGKDLLIRAQLPPFFQFTMKKLKLNISSAKK